MSHTLFATWTGKLIDFSDMHPEDICLEDIAHHLTNIQRFGGSFPLNIKYSVASHSLNCYQIAKWLYPDGHEIQKYALMHDATEAYLGDIVSGLKHCLDDYKKIENKLFTLINNKYKIFNLYGHTAKEKVNEIDKRMMLTEVFWLNVNRFKLYSYKNKYQPYYRVYNGPIPDSWQIKPDKYPELIKQLFLKTCEEVGIHD